MAGKYGAIASVKVMWPRTEEEKRRNRNCGFVRCAKNKKQQRRCTIIVAGTVAANTQKTSWPVWAVGPGGPCRLWPMQDMQAVQDVRAVQVVRAMQAMACAGRGLCRGLFGRWWPVQAVTMQAVRAVACAGGGGLCGRWPERAVASADGRGLYGP